MDLTTRLVTSCVSDAQNCGKMRISELTDRPFHHFGRVGRSKLWYNANFSRRRSTLSSLRACRTVKTVVKYKFRSSRIDPFVTSCVSDAQNCGKMRISELADGPFHHFGRVGRLKLWYKTQISHFAARPFRHFGRVGRSKLW